MVRAVERQASLDRTHFQEIPQRLHLLRRLRWWRCTTEPPERILELRAVCVPGSALQQLAQRSDLEHPFRPHRKLSSRVHLFRSFRSGAI
jgi:hypothetical protein